jgi:hypothetical protein
MAASFDCSVWIKREAVAEMNRINWSLEQTRVGIVEPVVIIDSSARMLAMAGQGR